MTPNRSFPSSAHLLAVSSTRHAFPRRVKNTLNLTDQRQGDFNKTLQKHLYLEYIVFLFKVSQRVTLDHAIHFVTTLVQTQLSTYSLAQPDPFSCGQRPRVKGFSTSLARGRRHAVDRRKKGLAVRDYFHRSYILRRIYDLCYFRAVI